MEALSWRSWKEKVSSSLIPYEVERKAGGVLSFSTESGLNYKIAIYSGEPTFPQFPDFNHMIGVFAFETEGADLPPHKPDFRVRDTVCNIILKYLDADEDNILFFVCDSVDGKQKARMSLFERWFQLFQNEEIEKKNFWMKTGNLEVYAAFLIRSRHSMRGYIHDRFLDLVNQYEFKWSIGA